MIIATLTTLPSRIGFLEPVIDSMLAQSMPPDEIRLQLPRHSAKEDTAYQLPAFLESYPKVKVYWHEQDYGPATKWLPALLQLKGQDCTLVVMDDDCFYPKDMLSNLLDSQEADTLKAYCSTGGLMNGTKVNHLRVGPRPVKNTLTIITDNIDYQRVDTVQGFSLVVFDSKLVMGHALDLLAKSNLLGLADDILLSALFEANGIGRIQIAPYQIPQPLEQAEINPIHGDGRLANMSLKTLRWVQHHLNVWPQYEISTNPKESLSGRFKGKVKRLFKGK